MIDGLLIVDMQPHFATSSLKRLRRNVIRLCGYAKAANLPVVVLEYDLQIEDLAAKLTYRTIMKALMGARYRVCQKRNDGGGSEAIDGFADLGLNLGSRHTIGVCGVNTTACVEQTVRGIHMATRTRTYLFHCATNGNGDRGWNRREVNRINSSYFYNLARYVA